MRGLAGSQTDRQSMSFAGADGARIDAWLYRPDPAIATGTTILMAHGIGGIKSADLAHFAERFAAAGDSCVVFGRRHFGASDGAPRELLRIRRQRDDYRAALEFARQLPQTLRTVVWGCSFAGLHATSQAVQDRRLAAAIAICPLVDGAHAIFMKPVRLTARLTAAGLADLLGAAVRRPPRYVPISVPEGGFGVLPAPDSLEGRVIPAPADGVSWPNRVTARSLLGIVTADRCDGWVARAVPCCWSYRRPTRPCRPARACGQRGFRGSRWYAAVAGTTTSTREAATTSK